MLNLQVHSTLQSSTGARGKPTNSPCKLFLAGNWRSAYWDLWRCYLEADFMLFAPIVSKQDAKRMAEWTSYVVTKNFRIRWTLWCKSLFEPACKNLLMHVRWHSVSASWRDCREFTHSMQLLHKQGRQVTVIHWSTEMHWNPISAIVHPASYCAWLTKQLPSLNSYWYQVHPGRF